MSAAKLATADPGTSTSRPGKASASTTSVDHEVEFLARAGRIGAGPFAQRELRSARRLEAKRGGAAVGGDHLRRLASYQHVGRLDTRPGHRHLEPDLDHGPQGIPRRFGSGLGHVGGRPHATFVFMRQIRLIDGEWTEPFLQGHPRQRASGRHQPFRLGAGAHRQAFDLLLDEPVDDQPRRATLGNLLRGSHHLPHGRETGCEDARAIRYRDPDRLGVGAFVSRPEAGHRISRGQIGKPCGTDGKRGQSVITAVANQAGSHPWWEGFAGKAHRRRTDCRTAASAGRAEFGLHRPAIVSATLGDLGVSHQRAGHQGAGHRPARGEDQRCRRDGR
jgi:hypothetical protein